MRDSEDFMDTGTSTAELRSVWVLKRGDVDHARRQVGRLQWKGTNEAELVTLGATGTWELANAPRVTNLEGSFHIRHAKDNAVADTERYRARLGAHGTRMADTDNFAGNMARLTSIQAGRTAQIC